MKFGRVFHLELVDEDLPRLRYKLLKRSIKNRVKEHEVASIFQTGAFKKLIRDDLAAINACWLKLERDLLARRQAAADLPYLLQQHEERVSTCLKWLALNYLAVLKIAKKHDKHCGTQLHGAMGKVLLMQPFVIGMRASPLFFPEAGGSGPVVLGLASRPVRGCSLDAPAGGVGIDAVTLVISQLLGTPAAHYFPQRLQYHLESLEDSCGSLSDLELNPDPAAPVARTCSPPVGRSHSSKDGGRVGDTAGAAEALQCHEHGRPMSAHPSDEGGWMVLAYLVLVG
jgi:hypothetical protein